MSQKKQILTNSLVNNSNESLIRELSGFDRKDQRSGKRVREKADVEFE
jgi:hypothetical protein